MLFRSEDPAGQSAGAPNLFVYANGNPVNFTDRTGWCADGNGGSGWMAWFAKAKQWVSDVWESDWVKGIRQIKENHDTRKDIHERAAKLNSGKKPFTAKEEYDRARTIVGDDEGMKSAFSFGKQIRENFNRANDALAPPERGNADPCADPCQNTRRPFSIGALKPTNMTSLFGGGRY